MKKWKQKAINEIMENFDFVKVEKTMNALSWKWATTNGTSEIPSLQEIKETALDCLDRIKDFDKGCSYGSGTGGFYVNIDNKRKLLSLQFSVSEWDNY